MKRLQQRASAIVVVGGVALASLLASLGYAKLVSMNAHAEETLWQPFAFAPEVPAGDALQLEATFVSSQDLEDVVVRLGPALEGYVRVMPSKLSRIDAGTSASFSIEITPPGNADPTKLSSALSLENAEGHPIDRSTLPITLVVTAPVLQGLDANDNGIWDYVDIFIRDNIEENAWHASRQLTKALQESILYSSDSTMATSTMKSVDRAIGCIYHIDEENAPRTVKSLEAYIPNTPIRAKAYLAFSEHLAGTTTYVSFNSREEQCDR